MHVRDPSAEPRQRKQPVVGTNNPEIETLVRLNCEVEAETAGTVIIRLADGVETADGRNSFEVAQDQLLS